MSVLFEEMNREQLAKKRDGIVLIPVGACEQHGPHLATGSDFFIVRSIAEQVARKLDKDFPVVVAPTLPFGFSQHHIPFGATISITPDTYQAFLRDMCNSLLASGFKKLFFINGHGGNNEMIAVVAREFALTNDTRMGAGSYWTMAWNQLIAAGAHELEQVGVPTREGDFAADPKSFYPAYMVEDQENWLKINGFSDNPAQATSANGEKWFNAVLEGVELSLRQYWEGSR
jgi:creatinine amidohydrolase